MKKLRIKKISLLFIVSFFLSATILFGQKNTFKYERKIQNIHGRWGYFLLPDDMYEKLNKDFSDIRIYSISESKQTTEVPYWIEETGTAPSLDSMSFQILNTTYNQEGCFFTFETKDEQFINQLDIEFEQNNFDWNIRLEGSNDQKNWFTIVDNYRLVAIQNEQTNYSFTSVTFKDAKFKYYRLLVKSQQEVTLKKVSLQKKTIPQKNLTQYNIKYAITEDVKNKETKIAIDLPYAVPVNTIQFFVKKDFDYFRSVSVLYRADSAKVGDNWQYDDIPLFSGSLQSKQENILQASNTITQKLIVLVGNQDNRPLTIDSIKVSGSPYKLVAYFTDTISQYVLRYGDPALHAPQYDIEHFKSNAPSYITPLTLGEATQISSYNAEEQSSVINKVWLWIVMIVLVILLGFFAFKMMKKVDKKEAS